MLPFERKWHDSAMAAARKALGEEVFTTIRQLGGELDLNAAITFGLDSLAREPTRVDAVREAASQSPHSG